MSRSTSLVLFAPVVLMACADLPSPLPAGRFTRIDRFDEDPYFLDELLAWPGGRDRTFGPTGDRLYADRLEPTPGLVGRFCMFHDTDALADPARLGFSIDGAEVVPTGVAEMWRPSHQELTFDIGPLDAHERKFITEDDVAVTLVTVENRSADEHELTVRVTSPSNPVAAFDQGVLRPFDLTLATNRVAGADAPPAGRMIRGGVPFETVAPTANAGRTLVAVGGTYPPFIEIPIQREALRIHLLTVAGRGVGDLPTGTVVATLQVFYRDGRPVALPLRAGIDVQAGVGTVTVETSPRRTVAYLRIDAGDVTPDAVPALAALSLETFVEPLAAQALRAERAVFGVPVVHALVAGVLHDGRLVERARVRDFAARPHPLEASVALPPGDRVVLRVAHAFTTDGIDPRPRAEELLAAADPLDDHRQRYHEWFDAHAPRLRSGEDSVDAVWWYRWFLVRRSLILPRAGLLPGRCAIAGRHGADVSRLDPAATAAVILEARWLDDPEIARDLLRAHVANAAPDGRFVAVRVDTAQEAVPHRLAGAAEALDTVHPDPEFLRDVVPALARDVEATAYRILDSERLGTDPRPFRDVRANALSTARLARKIGRDDLAGLQDALATEIDRLVPETALPGDPGEDGLGLADALRSLDEDDISARITALADRHLAQTDPPRVMLREQSDPRTGATPGRPDILRSTWIDLVYRYADALDWPSPWSRE